uniref:Uncharacterized protein LOC114342025 n=1 Tax=Diabrotica virgifera virgifera TaxID=50390 RepID=A0A6P7GTD8_DIAVI
MYDIKKDKPFYHTLRTLIFSLLYSTNHDKKYMSLSWQLNILTKKCMGLYSLIAALLFGSLINQIHNNENTVGGIIVFVGFFVGIFILCHAGEKIAQLNSEITDAVYNSSWYLLEVETRKDIIFILMSRNIKLYLEALPLGQLNFALLIM